MRKSYEGILENYFAMMDSMDWKIPAGSNSNCCDHYDISAVAETDNGARVCVIITHHDGGYFVTPVRTYEDGTSESNYGTPTVDKKPIDAVEKFNRDILDSRQYGCKLGIIAKMIVKIGKVFEFSKEDGKLERVINPDGQVIEVRGLREL